MQRKITNTLLLFTALLLFKAPHVNASPTITHTIMTRMLKQIFQELIFDIYGDQCSSEHKEREGSSSKRGITCKHVRYQHVQNLYGCTAVLDEQRSPTGKHKDCAYHTEKEDIYISEQEYLNGKLSYLVSKYDNFNYGIEFKFDLNNSLSSIVLHLEYANFTIEDEDPVMEVYFRNDKVSSFKFDKYELHDYEIKNFKNVMDRDSMYGNMLMNLLAEDKNRLKRLLGILCVKYHDKKACEAYKALEKSGWPWRPEQKKKEKKGALTDTAAPD